MPFAPGAKRVLVFVGPYPSPYKPYYDTQFIDLIRAGHDLQVVAAPPLDAMGHEKAREHGVLDRTHYYPIDARGALPGGIIRVLTRPLAALRFMARLNGAPLRRKLGDVLRMTVIPAGRPDFILVHGLGVAITFSWLGEWYPEVPKAMYYHGGEVASVSAHDGARAAQAFNSFDVVFTNTDFSKAQAISRGCDAKRLRVLPVGFDLDDYCPPAPRRYRVDGVLRVVSVGRLSEEKGLSDALEALKLVVASGRTQIRMSFVGDGYMRSRLEAEAASLGMAQNVEFLGALSTDEVKGILARADALVLSSYARGTWTETQACAVQEAMLMKAAVVTTRTGGVPESIPAVMHRFSAAERDVDGLAAALSELYDASDAELASLGETARHFVAGRYEIGKLNNELFAEVAAIAGPVAARGST